MNQGVPYSELKDYELIDKRQDVRGWPVKDAGGRPLGTVRELMVDTAAERVANLVLDSGQIVPATEVSIADHVVVVGDASPRNGTAAQVTSAAKGATEQQVVPVVEEFLRVGKRDVSAGGVRVQTHVTTQPVQETVQLREEHVSVERRPANRAVSPEDVARLGNQTVEVTAMSEEAVVAKTARVVEEIVIRKDVRQHEETVRDTVKKTDVEVQDLTAQDVDAYRSHYSTNYAKSGYTFEQYAPAYKFGHGMRNDARFRGSD